MTKYCVCLEPEVWSTVAGVLSHDINKTEEHYKTFQEERFSTLLQRLSEAKTAIQDAGEKSLQALYCQQNMK